MVQSICRLTPPWACVVGFVISGCGSQVVVGERRIGDGGSSPSGSAAETSSASGGQHGGGGGFEVTCEALRADWDEALAAAIACDPELAIIQCDGTSSILDECACVVLTNEARPDAVDRAHAALASFLNSGCPFSCDPSLCPTIDEPGLCGASSVCEPAP